MGCSYRLCLSGVYFKHEVIRENFRPVPNVALLPCRTKFKNLIRLKHGSSTTFETIWLGRLNHVWHDYLARQALSTPVVLHGFSGTWFQLIIAVPN